MKKEDQVCFLNSEGFLVCNCIMRNGVCVETKSGKWWRFRVAERRKKKHKRLKKPIEVEEKKIATTSEKQ